MAIQAIIMAGGAGVRLRPLTCESPKPLAPLCGTPIMDYSLRLLQKHGYDHADVTLWYRPEDVQRRFGDGARGVSLSYIVEDKPVGTAGSVLMAAPHAADTVLVLSGDGLTSVDLDAALAFHRSRRSAATLVLKHIDIPLAYGLAVTDKSGRITRFIEKPDWSRVVTSLVNTGVYLLEPEALSLIPPDAAFDFGHDLFPLMLSRGLPIYGYETDAYWCDVGSPEAFLQAQADLLAGRTGFAVEAPGIRSAPCVQISPDSYVSARAILHPGAVIRRSCVLDEAEIGPEAQLNGAIVCSRARVGRGAQLEPGSVLGAGSSAGAFATLRGQARIWPGIALPDDALIDEALRQPSPSGVAAGLAACATPMDTGRAAAVFLAMENRRRVAVMHDGSLSRYHSVLGALSAYGACEICMLGQGSAGMLSYAVRAHGLDGGLLCREDGLLLMDAAGLRLNDRESGTLESALRRQELPALNARPGSLRALPFLGSRYIQELAKSFYCERGTSVTLLCGSRFLSQLARSAIALAGHTVRSQGAVTLRLEEGRASLALDGKSISPLRQWLLCVRALSRQGKPVYDTSDFDFADASLLPPDGSDACIRQRLILQDGIATALLLLWLFARETPEEALAALPEAAHRSISIPCAPGDKGRVLEQLLKDAVPAVRGGLSARHGDAQATIRADPTLPLMHVSVSARSTETAGELCDFYAGKVLCALRGSRTGAAQQ